MSLVRLSVAAAALLVSANLAMAQVTPSARMEGVRPASAQQTLSPEAIRYLLSVERRKFFEENIQLAPADQGPFWELYAQFELERGALVDRRLASLAQYAKTLQTASNAEAIAIARTSLQYQTQELEMRRRYFDLMSSKLNGIVAARFLQLDDAISSLVRVSFLSEIPLVGVPPM